MLAAKILAVAVVCAVGVMAKDEISETKFERCSLLDKNRKDLCFKTIINEIVVKVGAKGTNDDVTMEICSDLDATQCCKTPALKSAFSDDWSDKDTERWGTSYFGKCKNFEFTVKRGLLVTLSKTGPDDLLTVDSITIDTKSKDKKNKEPERFLCGDFKIGGTNNPTGRQSKLCKTGPYNFNRVYQAHVQIGNDGTNDNVKFKICSDSNEVCCEKKLSGTFSDDWKKNKLEKWDTSYFGDCAKKLYKITTAPRMSVSKDGKDNLSVTSVKVDFDVIDTVPKRVRYTCEGFNLSGDCKNKAFCTHAFNSCKKSDLMVDPKTKRTIESGTSSVRGTPGSGGKLTFAQAARGVTTTTRKPTTTTKKTTKKPKGVASLISNLVGKKTTTTTTTTTTQATPTTTKKGILSKIFGRRR